MEPRNSLPILYPGNCEPLKATFHAAAMMLAATMGAYNAAAWIRRRQTHLAVNAVIYLAATVWEQRHVAHHLVPCVVPAAAGVEKETTLADTETSPRAA